MKPITIKNESAPDGIEVPCGKCPACMRRRTSGWAFRLAQECKQSVSAHFITLTYATAFVPISRDGYMELRKRDLQLFFKRLRKAHEVSRDGESRDESGVFLVRPAIKYYAVGEYGGRTLRPHYHLLLFNVQLELIQPAWSMGQVHYGAVSPSSIGYTLKYMCKQRNKAISDTVQPEFSLMSKGLGSCYLTPVMLKWHHSDLENRMYCPLLDGKKIAMPRYFKEKIYTEYQRETVSAVQVRKAVDQQLEDWEKVLNENKGDFDKALQVMEERIDFSYQRMFKKSRQGRDKVL